MIDLEARLRAELREIADVITVHVEPRHPSATRPRGRLTVVAIAAVIMAAAVIAWGASSKSVTVHVRPSGSTVPRPHPHPSIDIAALPASGFAVLADPQGGGATRPASWAITLVDDGGHRLGDLPRAVVSNDTFNSPQRVELAPVSATPGVSVAHRALGHRDDDATGCTTTATSATLRVALCGSHTGEQLLGDRIAVLRGSTWSTLISTPPAAAGTRVGGHWVWAGPSPDGRSILAQWSGECEAQTALLISVDNGSVRAVTGAKQAAWSTAPESVALGWTTDGRAAVVFGGESACGASTKLPHGVYSVSPDAATRRLLLRVAPSDVVLRWTNTSSGRISD